MKVIIAGPRDFDDYDVVVKAIEKSGFNITEVISGGAAGVDTLGEQYARENNITVTRYVADWNNLKQKGAVIKINSWKKQYNANAGFYRNGKMAKVADALIAIQTGSHGTADMIKKMEAVGKLVFTYCPEDNLEDAEVALVF